MSTSDPYGSSWQETLDLFFNRTRDPVIRSEVAAQLNLVTEQSLDERFLPVLEDFLHWITTQATRIPLDLFTPLREELESYLESARASISSPTSDDQRVFRFTEGVITYLHDFEASVMDMFSNDKFLAMIDEAIAQGFEGASKAYEKLLYTIEIMGSRPEAQARLLDHASAAALEMARLGAPEPEESDGLQATAQQYQERATFIREMIGGIGQDDQPSGPSVGL